MDQDLKVKLRPSVTAWVSERFPSALEVAPQSGQRFVFRSNQRAIKLLPPLSDDDKERCRREVSFLIEASIAGLPEVLTELIDVDIDGVLFSVYEEAWIEADSLKKRVEDGVHDPEQGLLVLREGARILSELHSHNVVHRDVSFGNVLVGDAGLAIVDLGLAKYFDLDPLTGTSERLKLTLAFASPEQITSGSSTLGFATDVYSLALVAIFAAVGDHAFLRAGQPLVLPDHLARMAHRDLIVDVSALPDIVNKMLEPIASYRPTAAQVFDELS